MAVDNNIIDGHGIKCLPSRCLIHQKGLILASCPQRNSSSAMQFIDTTYSCSGAGNCNLIGQQFRNFATKESLIEILQGTERRFFVLDGNYIVMRHVLESSLVFYMS